MTRPKHPTCMGQTLDKTAKMTIDQFSALFWRSLIPAVFLETHGDDTSIAPHHCDTHKAELEAQGFLCSTENLFTVNGDRLFILVATSPHAAEFRGEFLKSDRPSPSKPSSQKRILPTRNPAASSVLRLPLQYRATACQYASTVIISRLLGFLRQKRSPSETLTAPAIALKDSEHLSI
jgi:hypothetical protein